MLSIKRLILKIYSTHKLAILIFSLFILTPLKSTYAQNHELSDKERREIAERIIETSDYIFVGTIKGGRSYESYDYHSILSSLTIEVSHVLKGENLKNGSIEFLQAGGTVGNKSCYPSHGSYIYFENGVKEDELIFFCKSTDLPSPDDLNKFDNTHKIEIKSKPINLTRRFSKEYEIGGLGEMRFDTKENFFTFLSEFPELNIPRSDKKSSKKKENGDEKELDETIEYTIKNQQVVEEDNELFYSFDIYDEVTTDNLFQVIFYFGFSYNTDAFGESTISDSLIVC